MREARMSIPWIDRMNHVLRLPSGSRRNSFFVGFFLLRSLRKKWNRWLLRAKNRRNRNGIAFFFALAVTRILVRCWRTPRLRQMMIPSISSADNERKRNKNDVIPKRENVNNNNRNEKRKKNETKHSTKRNTGVCRKAVDDVYVINGFTCQTLFNHEL